MTTPDVSPRSRVAVVVLTFNGEDYVERCLASVLAARAETFELWPIVVDNASSDRTRRILRDQFPDVELLESSENLGFAGGNNLGMRRALAGGADFIFLLNQDAELEPTSLEEALAVARSEPRAAAVQSLLLLADEPDRLNSVGNSIHFLGLGYCNGFRAPVASAPERPCEIAYASGAAVLLRAAALREAGLFDETLFLYHEDLDLGWRLRLAGWRNLLAPASRVRHHYAFSKNKRKLFFMERNRWLVLLKCLSGRTLLTLLPLLAAGEAAMVILAAKNGWLGEKLQAEVALLRVDAVRHVLSERRRISETRRVTDSEIFRLMRSDVEFEGVTTPFIRHVANPLMGLAWKFVRPLIS